MSARLTRWPGLVTRIILLAAVLWGSNLWLVRIRDSVANHRSVLAGQPALGEPSSPLVQQVVIVLVDGLTYDASLEMPVLNTLREQGLDARCRGYYPSYSQSAWTTLVSGAGPELSDAPLVDVPYDQLGFLTVDDLFTQAKIASLRTGLLGSYLWERMIPERVLDHSLFVTAADAPADDEVVERALDLLNNPPPNFLLVQLGEVASAARVHGTASGAYQDAVQRVDSQLRRIAQAISLRRNVLIVTSDHGYLPDGGYGGADEEVLITPLVMVGGRVLAEDYGQIDQADVAPTVAALLGLAVPSAAQGDILFETLVMDEAENTEKWVAWAQQRVELSDVYLQSIGQPGLSEGPKGDAEVAWSSLLVRNYGSASRLASFAVQGATSEMVEGRTRRIASEQRRRLPVALVPVLAVAYLLWRRWSRTTAALFFAGLTAVLLSHLLFVWEGNLYSFSTVRTWDAFVTGTLIRMATALLPSFCLVVWLAWLQRKRRPLEIAALNYSFTLILCFLLALPLAASYVLNGSEVTWRLPDPFFAFLQVFSLLQLGVAAFLALFIPLFTVPLDRILRWVTMKVGFPRR
jgi:hypothetical protein